MHWLHIRQHMSQSEQLTYTDSGQTALIVDAQDDPTEWRYCLHACEVVCDWTWTEDIYWHWRDNTDRGHTRWSSRIEALTSCAWGRVWVKANISWHMLTLDTKHWQWTRRNDQQSEWKWTVDICWQWTDKSDSGHTGINQQSEGMHVRHCVTKS